MYYEEKTTFNMDFLITQFEFSIFNKKQNYYEFQLVEIYVD